MSAIQFEDPPGGVEHRRDWAAIGTALRDQPQRWAVVAAYSSQTSAANTAKNIRESRLAALRPFGTFEAVSRTVDGERRVYARWVGESS